VDQPVALVVLNRMRSRRRLPLFDALGVAALLAFLGTVAADLAELRRDASETPLVVDPAETAAGFREGIEWQGIYDAADRKVGYVRVERRRVGDGWTLESLTTLRRDGAPARIEVRAELSPALALRSFSAEVSGEAGSVSAVGRVEQERLRVEVGGLPVTDGSRTLDLPADHAALGFSWHALVQRADLRPGRRFSFERFDLGSLGAGKVGVEYLGRDRVVVMGEEVLAHHLRQEVLGEAFNVWVNDLGEALREELPGGYVAVRESEAEATYALEQPTGGEP
jgi:hypothetical protein